MRRGWGFHVTCEVVQTSGPERAIALDPIRGVSQRISVQLAAAYATLTGALDETGALEDAEVLGDRRPGHAERPREVTDGRVAARQASENRPPDRIGEGTKGMVESLIGNHSVTNMPVTTTRVNGARAEQTFSASWSRAQSLN